MERTTTRRRPSKKPVKLNYRMMLCIAVLVFFLLALAGAACGLLLYAAGSALQILCDIRGAVKDKLR